MSNHINDTTALDAHLQSMLEALHSLQKAHSQGTLKPEAYGAALQSLAAYYTRDYPAEQSSTVAEASAADLLENYLERIKNRKAAAPTGLGGIDAALNGGFQARRLVTLLGAPGGGKTSLANQWAEKVACERPVFYVTSEDTPDVLIAKSLARIGNVNYGDVLYGRDMLGIQSAMQKFAARPSARLLRYLDVSAGTITLDELRARAAAHFEGQPGPGLIVVDYLQRMARATRDTIAARDLRESVTALTERLRAIACELDCCVLAIASMNRASNYSKVSEDGALASAKESGDIEYTADVMMALTEDNAKNQRITASYIEPRVLRIAKNRQGPVTSIKLDWRADRQQFTEAQEVQ